MPEEDGSNLLAEVMIPNYSMVEFELVSFVIIPVHLLKSKMLTDQGNQTLNLNGPDSLILGNATIQNVYVAPGSKH